MRPARHPQNVILCHPNDYQESVNAPVSKIQPTIRYCSFLWLKSTAYTISSVSCLIFHIVPPIVCAAA
jgi:hypothetical protein